MGKECFVPSCSNNSSDNPNLLFVRIHERLREDWCRQVNAEYFKTYLQFCCEDHLNPEDIKNYYKCKIMNDQPQMAPTAQLRRFFLADANKKRSILCELLLQRECTPSAKSGKQKLDKNTLPRTTASTLPFNEDSSSSGDKIKVFCPKCNTEVPHSAEGIREDQTKILVAKVYHYLEQEFEELKKIYVDLDLTPLSKFRQRTALATGVSETTVLQILKEEEGQNADKRQDPPETRRRARKRSRQTDSSSDEDSSDDNVDDGGQSSFVELAQNEPEVETLVVKLEPPEHDREQVQTDPLSTAVMAEPPDDVIKTNKTLTLIEPAGTKRRARKIPRSDVTSTRQHTQDEATSAAVASIVQPTEELHESGLLGENEVKVEIIETEEEGFS